MESERSSRKNRVLDWGSVVPKRQILDNRQKLSCGQFVNPRSYEPRTENVRY